MGSLGLDLNLVTQLTSTTINLDSIVEEFFKGWPVENTVVGWLAVINKELEGTRRFGLRGGESYEPDDVVPAWGR